MNEATSKTQEALVGTVIADRYRVERLLGSGGMGSVYLAEHVLMKKPVALKVLHPEMLHLQEIAARFEREAIASGRIDHLNVAGATDFGRLEDGSLYLVLEYIRGRSLSDLLREGRLDVERVLGIARQIAAALSAAHAAGVVHRDLKPDNVMLVEQQDGRDVVKVLDFGIAKVLDDTEPTKRDSKAETQLTRIGTVMGTASYMSPEQAVGQSVDHRADLYSFGVMLYEMLAGRLPFDGEELAQILAKQLTELPPPLPQTTPPELAVLVNKLLEKRPDDRIQSAAELVEIIDGLRESLFGIVPASSEKNMTFAVPAVTQPQGSAGTLLDAAASVPDGDLPATRSRRGPVVAAGLIAIAALGGLWAWTNAGSPAGEASAAESPMPSAVPADSKRTEGPGHLARTPPALRATAAATATPAPAPADTTTASSKSSSTTTESSVTSDNGTTVKTKKSSTKTTSRTTRKRTKRKEGPGGIYIPPPSDWF